MCDETTEADNSQFLSGGISRRDFGMATIATGAMLTLPRVADAAPITGRDVMIKMADGVCDAYFVAPQTGKHPAVLVWPDIFGLRPAFRQMADRLAEAGYAVLTVNPFYRSSTAAALTASGGRDAVWAKAAEYRKWLTPQASEADAKAYIAFIDSQPEVDVKRGIGTTGYCMGGPLVMRTAAAVPERVRAVASFHGVALATDAPDSPHLLVPQMKAGFLIAVAANDDEKNPREKEIVGKALADHNLPAEIEVYAGALHGWCPPDSTVYHAVQAERAWARLLVLLNTQLRRT